MSVNLPVVPATTTEEIIANSFRDFHTKGFDYICLRRSPAETVKLYFFDGDVSKLPEIVNPHDHRYDFSTLCVTGRVQNVLFKESFSGQVFNRFSYDTPLLGGKGFTWVGETKLVIDSRQTVSAGRRYHMGYNQIHTIRMMENNTVICLVQHEDKVTDRPTLTFARDRVAPSLDGLYRKFTADTLLAKLRALQERVPGLVLPRIH